MPGWYIHMEAAKKTADQLRNGDVPIDFPIGKDGAIDLGEIAYKWRNYLAAGALGPDIFFLLPDFSGDKGNVLRTIIDWIRDVWEVLDEEFLKRWNEWAAPVISGVGNVINQISGGVAREIGTMLQELAELIKDAILGLLTKLYDWFGLLTSGVPKGWGDSGFYWSDMFHYRKTFEFARKLYENATTEQHKAFAIGWMSHCATDVTGHSFVNAKCGGPFRLHWQRHHLVENHMDARVYDAQHGGTEPYGEMDTAALHFRLAFRNGQQAPYLGASDAPAYDYFTGLPGYPTDDSAAADHEREELWDLDTLDLPADLCRLIIDTMADVYGDDGPRLLTQGSASFHDGSSGRPSVDAIQDTWWTLYKYVKYTSTSGYSPRRPTAPPVFNDHSPPSPPGFGGHDDPARGGDDDDDFDLLDMLLAVLSWPLYLAELGVWFGTLPVAVINDLATYPVREVLYENVVVPMWSAMLAARQPLVMTGFLMPKHEEISEGLVRLGISTAAGPNLAAMLKSPTGVPPFPVPDEPSGRQAGSPRDADAAYPRSIIRDDPSTFQQVFGAIVGDSWADGKAPSEFLRPWRYPHRHNDGTVNGWEPSLTHAGPWQQWQDATALFGNDPGHTEARRLFDAAKTPHATEEACDFHLGKGEHLGDPVDYGLHVIGRMTSGDQHPDYNLDADRGYGYHCWDWNRMTGTTTPDGSEFDDTFKFGKPCTPPEGYQGNTDARVYDAHTHLAIHYLEGVDPGCNPHEGDLSGTEVTPDDIVAAGGLDPAGRKE